MIITKKYDNAKKAVDTKRQEIRDKSKELDEILRKVNGKLCDDVFFGDPLDKPKRGNGKG